MQFTMHPYPMTGIAILAGKALTGVATHGGVAVSLNVASLSAIRIVVVCLDT